VELSGHSAKNWKSRSSVLASLYMSAMMHLGLMHEQVERRADLIGARQTIDTLGLLREKQRQSDLGGRYVSAQLPV
jgi:hypothetical protein